MTVEQRISRLHSVIDEVQLPEDDHWLNTDIDKAFNQDSPAAILASLEQIDTPWSAQTLALLNKRSPSCCVSLRQIQLENMSLADELRLERTLVRHCFYII